MGDYAIIPRVAILVPENDDVIGHRQSLVSFLEFFGELLGFAGRGIREVDMVEIGAAAGGGGSCGWSRGRRLRERDRREGEGNECGDNDFHDDDERILSWVFAKLVRNSGALSRRALKRKLR